MKIAPFLTKNILEQNFHYANNKDFIQTIFTIKKQTSYTLADEKRRNYKKTATFTVAVFLH